MNRKMININNTAAGFLKWSKLNIRTNSARTASRAPACGCGRLRQPQKMKNRWFCRAPAFSQPYNEAVSKSAGGTRGRCKTR